MKPVAYRARAAAPSRSRRPWSSISRVSAWASAATSPGGTSSASTPGGHGLQVCADRRRDDGKTVGHRFQERHRLALGVRGQDEQVGLAAETDDLGCRHPTVEAATRCDKPSCAASTTELVDVAAACQVYVPLPVEKLWHGQCPQQLGHPFAVIQVSQEEDSVPAPAGAPDPAGAQGWAPHWRGSPRAQQRCR